MSQFREDIRKKDFPKQFDKPIEIIGKLGKGTFKYIIDGITKIRLYETDIVEYKNNSIILNTGKFRTFLTKNRMKDALPIGYISQKNNVWYYNCTNTSTRFFDGIEIDLYTGNILNGNESPQCDKINKNDLPKNVNRDCFCCFMNDDCQIINTSKDHLFSHLNERYIMKSLIINALHETGYFNPQAIYSLYGTAKNKSAITRAVTKYFRKRLLKK